MAIHVYSQCTHLSTGVALIVPQIEHLRLPNNIGHNRPWITAATSYLAQFIHIVKNHLALKRVAVIALMIQA